jgi:hypothetical protein
MFKGTMFDHGKLRSGQAHANVMIEIPEGVDVTPLKQGPLRVYLVRDNEPLKAKVEYLRTAVRMRTSVVGAEYLLDFENAVVADVAERYEAIIAERVADALRLNEDRLRYEITNALAEAHVKEATLERLNEKRELFEIAEKQAQTLRLLADALTSAVEAADEALAELCTIESSLSDQIQDMEFDLECAGE